MIDCLIINFSIRLVCKNSQGIINFDWSHYGYFEKGGIDVGLKDTIEECANACEKDISCQAINYRTNKQCRHYQQQDWGASVKSNDNTAFIKCKGALRNFHNA